MDPVGNQRNNLQERWEIFFVKDEIITNIGNCPKQGNTPTRMWLLSFFESPFSQLPNRLVTFAGAVISKFILIMRHKMFTNGQSKNK
jgi:hypothetical protein